MKKTNVQGGTQSSGSSFAMKKIHHYVKQYIDQQNTQSRVPTVDGAFTFVSSLQEFQRINKQALKSALNKVWRENSSRNSPKPKSPKPSRSPNNDEEMDEAMESSDNEGENLVEDTNHNILNNMFLAPSYKKLNQTNASQTSITPISIPLVPTQTEGETVNVDGNKKIIISLSSEPRSIPSDLDQSNLNVQQQQTTLPQIQQQPQQPQQPTTPNQVSTPETPSSTSKLNGKEESRSEDRRRSRTDSERGAKRRKVSNSSSATNPNSVNTSPMYADAPSQDPFSNSSIHPSPIPKFGYSAMAGVSEVLSVVQELVEWPLIFPALFKQLGVQPTCGILLHGPPGCGKSMLASAIANELHSKLEKQNEKLTFYKISAPQLVSGMSGESESNIRALFADAKRNEPSLIFIDEVDVITTKRQDASKEMERRIVAQLILSFDELNEKAGGNQRRVIVLGATNRIENIDNGLRRGGRFDREIRLKIPNKQARLEILKLQTATVKLENNFDFEMIAQKTPGYVGADLSVLCNEAATISVKRILSSMGVLNSNSILSAPLLSALSGSNAITTNTTNNTNNTTNNNNTTSETPNNNNNDGITNENQEESNLNGLNQNQTITITNVSSPIPNSDVVPMEISNTTSTTTTTASNPFSGFNVFITTSDFAEALKKVVPSSKREGFATIPNVSWADIGALEEIREELRLHIIEPIRHPDSFRDFGMDISSGVLLYGPPGCGKTLLAKAIATDYSASFISVKGPELLNKYVGETERAVRTVFERARDSAPCIIFFDELDALCPRRDDDSGNSVTKRVVNQLLTELDGLDDKKEIFVIGATNRPDMIDKAMLRPKRLGLPLYVPIPNQPSRYQILMTLTRHLRAKNKMEGVDLTSLSFSTEGYSGADLSALVQEASTLTLTESFKTAVPKPAVITAAHFQRALQKIRRSVSPEDEQKYLALKEQFSHSLGSST